MNTLLTLRGKSFTQKSRNNGMGPITIPNNYIGTFEVSSFCTRGNEKILGKK